MLEFLLLDLDVNTLIALNFSFCIGILLNLVFVKSIECSFGAPVSNIARNKDPKPLLFNKNRILLIQFLFRKRITKFLRRREYRCGDDTDISFSLFFNKIN